MGNYFTLHINHAEGVTGPEEAIYMIVVRPALSQNVEQKLGGSGGMLPQENFVIYNIRNCF